MEHHGNCLSCKSFSKSIFSCLDKNTINKSISPHNLPMVYKKGQELYTEGVIVKGVFCIESGKVKVYKACVDRNLVLSLSVSSDIIGYPGIFNGGAHINSAKCIEDTHVCFISKKHFLTVLVANPEMQTQLLKQSCQENHRISNLLRDLKCKNMLSRVVTTLLEINRKFGVDENKCLNLNLTRKEIAEISGTTTESAIRILNQLKREKAITFIDGRIKLTDINKLQKFS